MDFTDLYIDGAWHKAAERFDVINPATEEVLASVASADIADADAALDAAERAMRDWAARKPPRTFGGAAPCVGTDGRPASRTSPASSPSRTARPAPTPWARRPTPPSSFAGSPKEAVRADGMITHAPASGARIVVQQQARRPRGADHAVELSRPPWAPARSRLPSAAGCGVIIKPASETPLTMLALMPLLEEAGVPKGLVNVLPSRKTGALVDHMLHDPRVRVVSFTGSTGVGRKLLKSAADQVLKPAMELGGNAPCIVFEDADLDTAVDGTMLAKMRNLGEACTAANRIYVHEQGGGRVHPAPHRAHERPLKGRRRQRRSVRRRPARQTTAPRHTGGASSSRIAVA